MTELAERGLNFTVSMLGEQFSEEPDCVVTARAALGEERVEQWGRLHDRTDYLTLLARADVVVSTARHEFYGVAVLEAAWLGCFPLLPASLVYPELYPSECLYRTERQGTDHKTETGNCNIFNINIAVSEAVGRAVRRPEQAGLATGGPAGGLGESGGASSTGRPCHHLITLIARTLDEEIRTEPAQCTLHWW